MLQFLILILWPLTVWKSRYNYFDLKTCLLVFLGQCAWYFFWMGTDEAYWYSFAAYRSYVGALIYVLIRSVKSKKYRFGFHFIRGFIIQAVFLQTSTILYSGLSALLWFISVNLAGILLRRKLHPCPLSTTPKEYDAYSKELHEVC